MTIDQLELVIDNEQEMETLGRELAQLVGDIRLITLTGDLGAGKTTLVRGLLRGLGHEGSVKSPTFTLVEPYELNNQVSLLMRQDGQDLL